MMKKSRIMMSFFVIALAAALIGGATMAWFTAKAQVVNEFTAGTVMISAEETDVTKDGISVDLDNVNPGDCYDKEIKICNTGSKDIQLRLSAELTDFELNREWITGNWNALCFSDTTMPTTDYGWAQFIKDIDAQDVVTITVDFEGWTDGEDGYYYRNDDLVAGEESCAFVEVTVCFAGEEMGNIYQGASFTVTIYVEAIQASNDASF